MEESTLENTDIFKTKSYVSLHRSNYVLFKDFLDDRGVSDDSIWERMKTREYQGTTINRPTKLFSKSLHEPTGSNSNTINATPTVCLPSNTPVCLNYDAGISQSSEGIDSLEQFF